MEIAIVDRGNLRDYQAFLQPELLQIIHTGTPIFALGARVNGVPVGALAGAPIEGNFQLLSFYVKPEQRRHGVASALLAELIRVSSSLNELFDISCNFETVSVEQERLVTFLTSRGFVFHRANDGLSGSLPVPHDCVPQRAALSRA